MPKLDEFGFPEKLRDLSYEDAARRYSQGELVFFVDRGLAINAAASGLPTPVSASIAGLLFGPALLAIPFLWFFVSLAAAAFSLVTAIALARYSKWQCVRSVRKNAMKDEGMYDLLLKHRVIWFQEP